MNNGIPLRVDPEFYIFAKEMVERDPSLNQRKVTKNLAKKKIIIGELLFNPEFEREIMKSFNKVNDAYEENEKTNKKRFFL